MLVFAAPAVAQGVQESGQQDVRAILDEVRKENAELRDRVTDLESQSRERYGMGTSYQDVDVTLQLFGDVGVEYANPEPMGRGHTSGTFGTIDVFVSAQMGDHFQVLSESVLTGSDAEGHFHQERIWGAWTFDDSLYAKVGLEHSPITRWNRQYHHGAWLEPTIARPLLAGFEGGTDGFLPLHNSGVELGGSTDTGAGGLDYTVIVSNGRGDDPSDKQKVSDKNDEKAFVGALAFEPASIDASRFGIAVHLDDVPGDPAAANPVLMHDTEELVATAFVECVAGPFELLSEVALMTNETTGDGMEYDHFAAYLQLLLPLEDWTPYARFDVKDMDTGDPYLMLGNKDLDQWRQTLGVRNDFATHSAFKIEINFGERDERSGATVKERSYVMGAFQLAWSI